MKIYYSKTPLNLDKNEINSACDKLLKQAFLENGYNIDLLKIKRNQRNRPYIENLDFDFNLSHTKGFIALCMGKNVGVDCEKVRSVNEKVIKRVCSDGEIDFLNQKEDRMKEFIRIWTFKEAFTKMIGSGYSYSFKEVSVENAFCLYPDIKIYQAMIDDVSLTAVEEKGDKIFVREIMI